MYEDSKLSEDFGSDFLTNVYHLFRYAPKCIYLLNLWISILHSIFMPFLCKTSLLIQKVVLKMKVIRLLSIKAVHILILTCKLRILQFFVDLGHGCLNKPIALVTVVDSMQFF